MRNISLKSFGPEVQNMSYKIISILALLDIGNRL